ncbi:MAG: phosphate acyltransferase PlsX [Chloroflexi bacterium]|nr:MAG: phosphate acyltransferase PlsX [Chloroflexota bacterium]MBL1193540.1 phosphate acyltransferase PlsX [Chloroflexota bacterium]NOH10831.1 phosphate acyltransferase PlsX [Chloroflexota bacterium]
MRIVLDGMGSDNHPEPEVLAAVQAARQFGDEVILVGHEDKLNPLLKKHNASNVRVVHAPETLDMTDKPARSARGKAQNSMAVGMQMLKDGEVDAFVTAGNTGGAMTVGLFTLGRIKGVKRPALCALFPVKGGKTVLLDIGANAECRPEFLLQFAKMGSAYAETVLGKNNPRVGLISNGEEAGKGNDLVKESYPLLETSGLNFIGNVEGKEVFAGEADVVVTDGFTGNVILKVSEALAKYMTDSIRQGMMSSLRTKIGGALARPAFAGIRKDLDPAEIGAIPLLGLDGLVMVGHGRSNARALVSAIGQARQAVEVGLMDAVRQSIGTQMEKTKQKENA